MSCRSMPRYAMLVQPFLTRPCNFHLNINQHHIQPSRHYNCNKHLTPIAIAIGARQFHHPKPPLPCSRNETTPSHDDQDPTQQAVLKAISGRNGNHLVFGNYVSAGFVTEVSKTEGRAGQTTNMVIGDTVADDSTSAWLALGQKVNSYPTVRGFTAIGTGGDDFVQAMVAAVESVIQQPIPQGCVKQKSSSGGKYVSVNIGPIQVVSSEQVQAVYSAMRRDDRMKYFL